MFRCLHRSIARCSITIAKSFSVLLLSSLNTWSSWKWLCTWTYVCHFLNAWWSLPCNIPFTMNVMAFTFSLRLCTSLSSTCNWFSSLNAWSSWKWLCTWTYDSHFLIARWSCPCNIPLTIYVMALTLATRLSSVNSCSSMKSIHEFHPCDMFRCLHRSIARCSITIANSFFEFLFACFNAFTFSRCSCRSSSISWSSM